MTAINEAEDGSPSSSLSLSHAARKVRRAALTRHGPVSLFAHEVGPPELGYRPTVRAFVPTGEKSVNALRVDGLPA